MMSGNSQCIHCLKECKSSDSRPYPSSKSSDRIHNRCHIKKSLLDKQSKRTSSDQLRDVEPKSDQPKSLVPSSTSTLDPIHIMEKLQREQDELKKSSEAKLLNKMIENKQDEKKQATSKSNQFFFDMKAGVAKPHENKKYLHHRNLCELAPRYNDHGHQEDTIGRAYDHSGRDLNILEDTSDDDTSKKHSTVAKQTKSSNNPSSSEARKDVKDESCLKRRSEYHTHHDGKRSKMPPRVEVNEKNPCWFCLSSPHVEKHLIISIGEHCYLTLAKGGLNESHLLLLPIEHIQSIACQANSSDLLDELERFKDSLVQYFSSQAKGLIFFERNFRSVHWQLQVVPIPLDSIEDVSSKIKSISKTHCNAIDYIDIPKQCRIDEIIPPGKPYFFWQVEPVGQRFACQIDVSKSFFPVQFGRIVLADPRLLNCRDRVDWKSCDNSKEKYIATVEAFKKDYKPFDITQEDEL